MEPNLDLRARIGWGGVYADPEGQDERMFSHLALIEGVIASHKPDRGRLQLYLTSDWVEGVWSPKQGDEVVWKRKPVQEVAVELENLLR